MSAASGAGTGSPRTSPPLLPRLAAVAGLARAGAWTAGPAAAGEREDRTGTRARSRQTTTAQQEEVALSRELVARGQTID